MKSVTFDEARTRFETVFDLAAKGELVVIARDNQRIAVHAFPDSAAEVVAPPGYFLNDYDADEITELNTLAAQGPKSPLP